MSSIGIMRAADGSIIEVEAFGDFPLNDSVITDPAAVAAILEEREAPIRTMLTNRRLRLRREGKVKKNAQ